MTTITLNKESITQELLRTYVDEEAIEIFSQDLEKVRDAIENTGGVFKKWKHLEPILCEYKWCGPKAFTERKSLERRVLHSFIRVNSKAWQKAEQIDKILETEDPNTEKFAEQKRVRDAYKKEASTLASIAVSRMSKYHADRIKYASQEQKTEERKTKSVQETAQNFIKSLEKVINKKNYSIEDKKLAMVVIHAIQDALGNPLPSGFLSRPAYSTIQPIQPRAEQPFSDLAERMRRDLAEFERMQLVNREQPQQQEAAFH